MNKIMFKLGVQVLKFEQKRLNWKKGKLEKEIEFVDERLEELNEVLIRIR